MDTVKSLARIPSLQFRTRPLLKYAVALLFLANARSWPFMWHFRVFWPVISLRMRWYLLQLRILFKPKHERRSIKAEWLNGLCPVGRNPLEFVHTWKSWASPDDCDYNIHLSNSCYAKNLDCTRLQSALKCFPTLFRTGGWIALGATHYNFLREIPMFSPYEVRVRIAGWDSKWVYIVARYVTPPRGKSKKEYGSRALPAHSGTTDDGTGVLPDNTAHTGGVPYPILHTPSNPLDSESKSGLATPTPGNVSGTGSADTAGKALQRTSAVHVEPDGATLNCVVVNALCFKHGRITIPPALVLAVEGFSTPSAGAEPYSARNPPPSWVEAQKLVGEKPTDLRGLQAFYTGGWRAVPDGERWWDQALAGLEEQRRAGMDVVGALRKGMEGVRSL